jgi:hypothetical protein
MNGPDTAPRLVAAGILGFLLFNYPLLALFDVDARVLGVPVLWAYLFGAWLALIALVALVIRRSG